MRKDRSKDNMAATATVDESEQIMRKKLILLVSAALILLVAAIYLATAWFTKMTNVTGTEFQVAQWEFNLNYNVDDIVINVYEYDSLDSGHAAPGSAGYIPLILSAGEANTDVEYYLTIETATMMEEIAERIKFWYEDADENKIYIDTTGEVSEDTISTLEGIIEAGEEVEIMVYWAWVYEYEFPEDSKDYSYKDKENLLSIAQQLDEAITSFDEIKSEDYALYEELYIDAYNAFDTEVGKNPEAYADAMQIIIKITGVQVEPNRVEEEDDDGDDGGTD